MLLDAVRYHPAAGRVLAGRPGAVSMTSAASLVQPRESIPRWAEGQQDLQVDDTAGSDRDWGQSLGPEAAGRFQQPAAARDYVGQESRKS